VEDSMKESLTLVIGDKNLSSWSMRPWLALKASGISFKEIKIQLDTPKSKKEIAKHSPSGRVPTLIHGKTTVWDSLAICEYIAELAPDKNLWPQNPAHRAIARSLVAEMHSGFSGLRNQLSMDIQLKIQLNHLTTDTIADIKRILHIWHHSIKTNKGPFLFGKDFGITDAFYAPVVMRFNSYGVTIKDPLCQKYMKAISEYPAVREWVAAAKKEKPYRVTFE
jgi:glutathione S-transferase